MDTERAPGNKDTAPEIRSYSAPIIERAPLPIVEVQGNNHIVSFVNSAFCKLMGKTRAELIAKPFADIVPGGGHCVPILDKVYETGEAVTHAREDDSEPSPAYWLYAMWPALDADERPAGVIIQLTKAVEFRQNVAAMNQALLLAGLRQHESLEALQKMTAELEAEIIERKRVEEALRDSAQRLAETDRQKDVFMAILAHELRNPLAPIKSSAQILRLANIDNPTVIRAQAVIERQANHMARLVDDLLDVSRLQNGKVRLQKEAVNLADAVANALETCNHLISSRHHQVILNVQNEPPVFVDADPARLEQIVANIVGNAAKYTPSHGRIEVIAAAEEDDAVLRVKDNGAGIEASMLGRIFNVYTQVEQSLDRSQGGLGLGLKLVKELVQLHGGSVEVKSEGLGMGSEFIVRLPRLQKAFSSVRAAKMIPGKSTVNRKVLVVEDSTDILDTMQMLLTMNGHTVEQAVDGPEGIAKAFLTAPDVALIDIGLPILNGYEVAREIRSKPGGDKIVLVALSGYGQGEDKRAAAEAGFDHHLTKPVDAEELILLLNDLERFVLRKKFVSA